MFLPLLSTTTCRRHRRSALYARRRLLNRTLPALCPRPPRPVPPPSLPLSRQELRSTVDVKTCRLAKSPPGWLIPDGASSTASPSCTRRSLRPPLAPAAFAPTFHSFALRSPHLAHSSPHPHLPTHSYLLIHLPLPPPSPSRPGYARHTPVVHVIKSVLRAPEPLRQAGTPRLSVGLRRRDVSPTPQPPPLPACSLGTGVPHPASTCAPAHPLTLRVPHPLMSVPCVH
ncbi:hypothetical protein B0H16DRAFT_1732594 [Mycena metata]|uniref:Uncharacterized protein n=1 Tax=Mycena metata TaxID=1033252 RepID=A0AAD7I1F2_9AGAR|nr:hypothetical protein B0H16DRAFT_1732594 [Mycena metata]